MNFITFTELNRAITENLHRIPEDVDLVVGVPRSGILVATLIALQRNLPVTDIHSLASGRLHGTGSTRQRANWVDTPQAARHLLLVDDSVSTGAAVKEARKIVQDLELPAKVTTLAPYVLPTSFRRVDVHFRVVNHPRLFEWNYLHHYAMEHACVDIDGVLCEDPRWRDNDDGERYEHFIANARPRLLPTKPVGSVVTSRLERYRELTEAWLERHGIIYRDLVMMDGVTARERRIQGGHGQFKAEAYQRSGCALFIESNYAQAVEICRVARRPVFSIEGSTLIEPHGLGPHLQMLANDWRITVKQTVRKLAQRFG